MVHSSPWWPLSGCTESFYFSRLCKVRSNAKTQIHVVLLMLVLYTNPIFHTVLEIQAPEIHTTSKIPVLRTGSSMGALKIFLWKTIFSQRICFYIKITIAPINDLCIVSLWFRILWFSCDWRQYSGFGPVPLVHDVISFLRWWNRMAPSYTLKK